MSRIRGKNTKIELRVNEMLKDLNFAYEKHPKMFGNPDFILLNEKIVIFCDGDFWHGYNYRKKKPEKKFWREKIERNMRRDKRITRKLRRDGWSVIRLWEHDIERRALVCKNRIVQKVMDKRKMYRSLIIS